MTEINYTEAFDELQEIVSDMEDGQINVDELAQKVKRATELIRICKNKLTATEGDVQKILKELETQNSEDSSNF
ncbi:MAG: exodeoxyribonuclease VII small subunit [Flavobacteriales bacterium]|nr:exodeoxyribonuclease VII small subunit [Flavobacteriales bacterium]